MEDLEQSQMAVLDVAAGGFDIDEDTADRHAGLQDAPPAGSSTRRMSRTRWKPLFHPKQFWEEHEHHDLDANVISMEE